MKITKRQLKKIIREENARIAGVNPRLLREFGPQGTDGASPLLDFAHAYSGLGAAVQQQVEQVVSAYVNFGPESERFEDAIVDVNPNALQMAADRLVRAGRTLGGEAEDILDAIDVVLELYREVDNGEGSHSDWLVK